MYWVHCNKCFSRRPNVMEIFFLQCGHIICRNCISDKCSICFKNAKFSKLPVKEPKPTIDLYFQNPVNYGKHLLSALKFQFQNRINLEVKGAKLFKKIKETQGNCQKVDQMIERVQEDMKKDYLRIKKMKMFIEQTQMYKNIRTSRRDGTQNSDSGIFFQNSLNSLRNNSFLFPSNY